MFKTLLAASLISWNLFGSAGTALAEKRVALVIGNSEYDVGSSLRNTQNDASAVSKKLASLGFEVVEGYNLSYSDLRKAVRTFARETRDSDLNVFYYAGHGISVDNLNYMVPVDAQLNDAVDWEFEVYALADVLRMIGQSKGPSLVFLDACRDNPMAQSLAQARGMSTRSLSTRGLSLVAFETSWTTGSVIAYATEPGQVAQDGRGENSPFTTALLRHIGSANQDFASVASLITRDVLQMTDGEQRPRFDVSLTGPLILNPVNTYASAQESVSGSDTGGSEKSSSANGTTLEVEKVIFETARTSKDVADYRAYLDAFPNGAFATLARNAILRLEEEYTRADGGSSDLNAERGTEGELAGLQETGSGKPSIMRSETRSIVSSSATENQLAMTKQQRREVQLRLNLTGNKVGRPDGIFGKGTRRGIRSWQNENGFEPTGFLNSVQQDALIASTQTEFAEYISANPSALVEPARASSSKRRTKTSQGSKAKRSSTTADVAIGAFLGGVATGILIRN